VPDIFFGEQKDSTGFIGWKPSEFDIAVDAFVGNPEDLGRLFDGQVSRNIWKLVNVCHKSSLVRNDLYVNWTFSQSFMRNSHYFRSFDKNIESALQCGKSERGALAWDHWFLA
jgi:hypothetical protein